MKNTKVFIEEFKGNTLFTIWEVDEGGNKVGRFPLVSFGIAKGKLILKHMEELNQFLK